MMFSPALPMGLIYWGALLLDVYAATGTLPLDGALLVLMPWMATRQTPHQNTRLAISRPNSTQNADYPLTGYTIPEMR